MKIAFDLSSLLHTCLRTGKDPEGSTVEFEGKAHWINTAQYGYELAINSVVAALKEVGEVPMNCIFVEEGFNSKSPRKALYPAYKASRAAKPPEAYEQFDLCKKLVLQAMRDLGALTLKQDNAEGDDTLAWLACHAEEELVIVTNDNDLAVLTGTNARGVAVTVRVNGVMGVNKYGDFPHELITVYKALVGDPSDNIKGIPGFGAKAWEQLFGRFGVAGITMLRGLAEQGSLDSLYLDAQEDKMVAKLFEGRVSFLVSYRMAKLYPQWVNTMADPLQWTPGMVVPATDERLKKWGAAQRLVGNTNYDAAYAFLAEQVAVSPYFVIDLETSTSDESDEWLTESKLKVDVLDSRITGGSILFGRNMQYSYYMTVDHKDSHNITLEQFGAMYALCDPAKLCVAHNAAGFELPVLYKHFGQAWANNGWRGFQPNMVDTRIAASYWDENQQSHGLKQLTQLLFGYEQQTYAQVTQGRKMREIPATEVTHYGCDDVYTSGALWHFFATFMQLEHTYKAFMEYEQKPMYLQALSYVRGVNIDMPKLSALSKADDVAEVTHKTTLDAFLVEKGWEGTVCPVYTELTPANIKEAFFIITETPLETMVRKLNRLSEEIAPHHPLLAALVLSEDVEGVNKLVATHFKGRPELNTGSPKQLQALLYETIGVPVRLRNRPTDTMRSKGIREGSPRTDEDAIKLALRQNEVPIDGIPALNSLMELKFIGTRRGLYWVPYPRLLHHTDGKLHPEFRQSGTNTRRYTGANPNLQQMDSSADGVRSVLLPHHKNAVVLSLDESAQEVRTMADLCKDEALMACYVGRKEELRDVHSLVGAQLESIAYEDFRSRLKSEDKEVADKYNGIRQKSKITLFATLYGASAPKIAEGLSITPEEAQGYIDAIYERFPRVLEWKEQVETLTQTKGDIPIHGGTVRHLRALICSQDKYVATKSLRQAGNASIQSACATQIKRVMSRIWDARLLDDYDFQFYFSLHDEIVASVAKEHAVPVIKQLHEFMTEQFLSVIPSASSIGVGKAYAPLTEIGEVFDEEKLLAAIGAL